MPIARLLPVPVMRQAILYMLVSTAGFSLMNICVRLAAETLPATVIVNLRNAVTLLMLLPLVVHGGWKLIRTERLSAHLWRSIIGAVGMVMWTYCVTLMPLTHATALSFTAPLLVTLLATVILKEHATSRQYWALLLGFMGVLIILRPTAEGFDWNSLLVIATTTTWAITSLFIKSLSATEPPMRMVFYMNLIMCIITLPFGLAHWQSPTPYEWLLIAGISVFSILMHFTMVKAFSLAPVVNLMPFDFMRMVYSAILAYFIFGESSDAYTWVGAAIIIVSAVWAARDRYIADPKHSSDLR